jgi:hypothetical protein
MENIRSSQEVHKTFAIVFARGFNVTERSLEEACYKFVIS